MFDPIYVNVGVVFLFAIVDNVPIMPKLFKSISRYSFNVTLNTSVGNTMLFFASVQVRWENLRLAWVYTFSTHMKYDWTIVVSYFSSFSVCYSQYEVLKLYINPAVKTVSSH